jgi:hypothetical protein
LFDDINYDPAVYFLAEAFRRMDCDLRLGGLVDTPRSRLMTLRLLYLIVLRVFG